VSAANPALPYSGLIPYAPNAPFFSDNAVKTRWLALPDGQRIVIGNNNDFDFPNGSVLVKNFALGNALVETRLFMRHNDGNWAGYTYEWNDAGTEATRVVGGKTVQKAGQTWEYPSEAQCLQCHSSAAGRTLGLEVGQLNGDFGYPTGRTANQLTTLNSIDVLTPALTQTPAQLPVIPDPFGSAALGLRELPSALGSRAVEPRPALHHGARRDQQLRRGADARRARYRGSTADRARLGRAFGGDRSCESHGRGRDAAAVAACHRHRGRAAAQ
jgi:hypothetical protein